MTVISNLKKNFISFRTNQKPSNQPKIVQLNLRSNYPRVETDQNWNRRSKTIKRDEKSCNWRFIVLVLGFMFRNKSNLLKYFWVWFKSCWMQSGSVILVWRKLFLEGVHDLRSTIIYLDLVEPILNSKLLHPCNWNWVGSVKKRYNTPKQFSIPDQHDSQFLFENVHDDSAVFIIIFTSKITSSNGIHFE